MRNIYKPVHGAATASGLPARIHQELDRLTSCLASPSDQNREMLSASEQFLTRNSSAVLRQLIRERDLTHILLGLDRGWFPPEVCRKVLEKDSIQDLQLRLLLMNRLSSGESTSGISSGTADWSLMQRVKRWNFRMAAQCPELRMILSQWDILESDKISPAGSDGACMYVHPEHQQLSNGQKYSFDHYLHTITHCIFRHFMLPENADRQIWDLACDLAAEYHRAEIFSLHSRKIQRQPLIQLLARWKIPDYPPLPDTCSASAFYEWLMAFREQSSALTDYLSDDDDKDFSSWDILLLELEEDFHLDDHQLWYQTADSQPCSGKYDWNKVSDSMGHHSQGTRRGSLPGSRQEKMIIREQSQYDFRRYLRRYSTVREELQLDHNSFDYIPYHYGMMMYGNMPLLEPLEYTEASKVEELVIAIDTSGSCDTETVQKFLEETHHMLTRQENFFRKMQVHILQCDSMIHEHVVIHSTEEWMRYIRDIRILGRGGTDFTPVFTYVNKLQKQGQLTHLKGLMYFTDGDGIYPKEKTPYETAFIFTNQSFHQYPVPPWIVKLCLESPEFCSYHT